MDKTFDDFMKKMEKHPAIENGRLIVRDGFGDIVENLDPLLTAVEYFCISNDMFFKMHGFNWVPTEPYYSMARSELNNRTHNIRMPTLDIEPIDEIHPGRWGR